MTRPELKKLESVLQARARELVRTLAERNQIMVERSADAFDGSVDAADRELSAQALAGEFRLLRQVAAAQKRIGDGTFGICLRCEEGIPLKRLQAIPWAAFCLSCQEMVEDGRVSRPMLARAA